MGKPSWRERRRLCWWKPAIHEYADESNFFGVIRKIDGKWAATLCHGLYIRRDFKQLAAAKEWIEEKNH